MNVLPEEVIARLLLHFASKCEPDITYSTNPCAYHEHEEGESCKSGHAALKSQVRLVRSLRA